MLYLCNFFPELGVYRRLNWLNFTCILPDSSVSCIKLLLIWLVFWNVPKYTKEEL